MIIKINKGLDPVPLAPGNTGARWRQGCHKTYRSLYSCKYIERVPI